MWTNIFRIGDLQVISWFQFLPFETDTCTTSDGRTEQKDACTHAILSAHLHLQNEGFLSTWTNSFVGPWDPSQGVHNPDEKIKLWLFIPGRHSSVTENARPAVAKLRVIGSGLWLAPGDSEEVAVALSQALRNSLGRKLRSLSYVRFGDVFTKSDSALRNGNYVRNPQPVLEFLFSSTEEAIYVHIIVSARYVRPLLSDDVGKVFAQSLPVIVAPNGMLGRLTGWCSSDLARQVHGSKLQLNNGYSSGLPYVAQSPGCLYRGQSFYAEVSVGCLPLSPNDGLELDNSRNNKHHNKAHLHPVSTDGEQCEQEVVDHVAGLERTFIYPPEAVLIPMLHQGFVSVPTRRLWLHNWKGVSSSKHWPFWNFSLVALFQQSCTQTVPPPSMGVKSRFSKLLKYYNINNNSIGSNISSVSSTSSESAQGSGAGNNLDADADSAYASSVLATNNNSEKSGNKACKRERSDQIDSAVPCSKRVKECMPDLFSLIVAGAGSIPVASLQGWEDDVIELDTQTLVAEFGDFVDFFEIDLLSLCESPGTRESQSLMLLEADFGENSSSLAPTVEIGEQKLSPPGLVSFEGLDHQPVSLADAVRVKLPEPLMDQSLQATGNQISVPSTSKYDYLTKAEAVLTFAPEYTAVQMPVSEVLSSLFARPYVPKSEAAFSLARKFTSNLYSATPPSSSREAEDIKMDLAVKSRADNAFHVRNSAKLYTLVLGGSKGIEKKSTNIDTLPQKREALSSVSAIASSSLLSDQLKKSEKCLDAGNFLVSRKTMVAADFECIMLQISMCRIRHTLLPIKSKIQFALKYSLSDSLQQERNKLEIINSKFYIKKEDSLPVRIACDMDGQALDSSHMSQMNIWQPAGVPKTTKQMSMRNSHDSLLMGNTLADESTDSYLQKQSLMNFLCALALLVQQSTSFVDVSLDTNDGYGSYHWLALQEQHRRGFSCNPSLVHAGCGGFLSTSHSVDIAGVNLVDPLASDVPSATVLTMLQSDLKAAIKSTFGNSDGPLSLVDWCKGRSPQSDSGASGDGYSFQYPGSDTRESSTGVTLGSDSMSPSLSTGASSSAREGTRNDELSQRKSTQDASSETDSLKGFSRMRSKVSVLQVPAMLVGYQDDWLKVPFNTLQFWEKGPLEPYASPKPVTYCVICPNTDILAVPAVDFFLQLGAVYEICCLGTHLPLNNAAQMDSLPTKRSQPKMLLVDCPQEVKFSATLSTPMSSFSEYFAAASKNWSVKSYVDSLAKVIKDLKLFSGPPANQKENGAAPCTVIYVVCPFPEPSAVLQTLLGSSVALGSLLQCQSERERKSLLQLHVAKALNCSAATDETSAANVVMLSGFSVPKVVLQIISVETLLRMNRPRDDLSIYKDIAFTVYNKARRHARALMGNDSLQLPSLSSRSPSSLVHVHGPIPGLWKDCLVPRMPNASLVREDFDTTLRPPTWDSSWPSPKASTSGSFFDGSRLSDSSTHDDKRYLFEPLFIISEPGSSDHNLLTESSNLKHAVDDASGIFSFSDPGPTALLDGSEPDQKAASLHCCYGWTEDWRWLVCIWTDSRGELLDSLVFPFGGISSRQDTKILQSLFVQILQQACQIVLAPCPDAGCLKPRDIIITRIGAFFQLECQEWQNAIYLIGGNEVKRWPLSQQRRTAATDGISSNSNGPGLPQQELGIMQDRNLPPSPSTLYTSHAKFSYMKGSLGQCGTKKQHLAAGPAVDVPRGLLHWVQSISLVAVSLDRSLRLFQSDLPNSGGGILPARSLKLAAVSYLVTPSPSLRHLAPGGSQQLPTCLTSESPPLAHLLHSKGSAAPLATTFVVSKAVPHLQWDITHVIGEDELPSVLAIALVDYYAGNSSTSSTSSNNSSATVIPDKIPRGSGKQLRSFNPEPLVLTPPTAPMVELNAIVEAVAAELHQLSWMTASPVYLCRRTALPFHCDAVLRLRRLLHYSDNELRLEQTQLAAKAEKV